MSAFMAVGGVWLALECSNGRTKVRFNLKKKQQMADFPPRPAWKRSSGQRTILKTQTVVRFLPNLWWRFLWLASGRGQVRGWRGSSQKGAERPPGDGNGYTTPLKCDHTYMHFFMKKNYSILLVCSFMKSLQTETKSTRNDGTQPINTTEGHTPKNLPWNWDPLNFSHFTLWGTMSTLDNIHGWMGGMQKKR